MVAVSLLGAVAALILLAWLGIGPFGNVAVFVLSNVVGFFALLVLGVLGGAFVGMLVAHRIFSHEEFTPFERAVMQSLDDLKREVTELRASHDELAARVGDRDAHPVRARTRGGDRD